MSKFGDAVKRASAPRNWKDSMSAVKQKFGKKASRHIAAQAGVSVRTAQKWLAGTQAPTGASGRESMVTNMADDDWLAADAIANAQGLYCGHVDVEYNGKSQGTRNVGYLSVDGALRSALQTAAGMYNNGDTAGAEQVMSDAILDAYAVQHAGDGRNLLQGVLRISNFRTGFNIV